MTSLFEWTDLLTALFLISVIIWWFIKSDRIGEQLKNIKGPPPLPIVGNALQFRSSTVILDNLMKNIQIFGKVMKIRIGISKYMIVISDPRWLEFIMSTTKLIDKSKEYSYLFNWLGHGLLTSTGNQWKKSRRIITPAFHFQVLQNIIPFLEKPGDVLIKKLTQEIGSSSIDIYPYINLCMLDIIGEVSMGVSLHAQENQDSEYVKSVKELCMILINRTFSPLKQFDFFYQFSRDFIKEKKAIKILHDYTDNVIKTRKAKLLEQKDNEANLIDKTKKPTCLIDILLKAVDVDGSQLTDLEVRQEVDTVLFAGHDTSSSAVSFTLYLLANHPKVQELAYEEQVDLFGTDKNPQVETENLKDMKYLESVIKESLRFYSPVPFYARETKEDIIFDDIILPKGVTLGIFAYGIHRDPEYYPDPDKFDPNRFLEPHTKSNFCYIPFSAGPRNCVGQKIGMLEMKYVISKILRHFELLPSYSEHKPILKAETILKSANGIKISLKERLEC